MTSLGLDLFLPQGRCILFAHKKYNLVEAVFLLAILNINIKSADLSGFARLVMSL
jgi:hypothetical protein